MGLVPERYQGWLLEPAFYVDETTHCFWWTSDGWRGATAEDDLHPAGLENLLVVARGVDAYRSWAEEMYEVSLDPERVRRLWDGGKVELAALHRVNPHLDDFAELASYGVEVVP